ncbi:MAG: Ig-like domain-containing protein [Fibrobacter sp.]|jgi:hypothetical protein|nr:Ig-like domain-containing protein [Fibrobacter sp.]
MPPRENLLLKVYLGILFLLFLVSCATVVAPGGGPEDKLTPRVAGIYPAPNSINQPTKLDIKVEFDEWINAAVTRGAVLISPPIEKRLRTEVDGSLLSISSAARLDSSTTYTVTVGSGIKDLRGNPLSEPFLLVFSTGPEIDSLSIAGRVLRTSQMIREKQFPSIGLYLMGESREQRNYLKKYQDSTFVGPDTLPRLTVEEPLFITQADSNGLFRFRGLKEGRYRVAAFVDLNGNQRMEPITEWAGLGESDVILDSAFADTLWLSLSDQDTTALRLETAEQVGNRILQATFSRNVWWDSVFTNPENCFLQRRDSSRIHPLMVYPSARNNIPHFYFAARPPVDSLLDFVCLSARDSLGRALDMRLNSASVTWKRMPADTLGPKLSGTIPASGTKMVFPKTPIELIYSEPVRADSLTDSLWLILLQDTVPALISQKAPNRIEVKGNENWATDSRIRLVRSFLDTTLAPADSTGFRDTIVAKRFENMLQFETVPRLRTATLEGKIPGAAEDTWVRLRFTESGEYRKEKCLPDGSFRFEMLAEGNYTLDYYHTLPRLDEPYAGALSPLTFAAPWRSLSEVLILKNGVNILDSLTPSLPRLPQWKK